MVIKESMHQTKNFIHKVFRNLKSSICKGYQKLPKSSHCLPSCRGNGCKDHQTEQFYIDLCYEWDSSLEEARNFSQLSHVSVSPIESLREKEVYEGSFMKFAKQNPVGTKKEAREKNVGKIGHAHSGKAKSCSQDVHGENTALARRMKELEMMDVGDMEHVLDVEEAMHYYSRLRSPVYLNIVDNFFMDMYSEFSVPRASVSRNRSKGRFSSMRL